MALQVWLPLNGDLRNQGVSDVTVTNSGATINTNGKIGSCYSFNGSSSYITTDIKTSSSMSFCCWVYFNSFDGAQLIDCRNNSAVGYQPMYITQSYIQIGNSQNGFAEIGYSFSASTWYHIVVANNESKTWVYINGSLIGERNIGGYDFGTLNIPIGVRCSRNMYYLNGRLNDVRIYDHCLSAAEVKEISLGLVLHYKLDDPYVEPTTNQAGDCHKTGNYSTSWDTSKHQGAISVYGWATGYNSGVGDPSHGYHAMWNMIDGIPTMVFQDKNSEIGQTHRWLGISGGATVANITSNTTYTVSFDAKADVDGKYVSSGLYYRKEANGSYNFWDGCPQFAITTQWKRYSYTYTTSTVNAISAVYVYGHYGTEGIAYVRNIQIELKDHATPYTPSSRNETKIVDSSGYGNHGTITGNMSISNNTGRYKCSTNFPDSACSITIGDLSSIIPEGNFTFNVWFKKITGEWSSKGYETIFGGPGGFELEAKRGATNSPELVMWNWSQSNTVTYSLDQWNMVTFCRDSSGTKLYLNGEQKATGVTGSIPSGTYFIGAWRSATEQNYRGYLADARLYSTVLSAEDIQRLYNTGALIDKKGNVHSYEIEETDAGRELMITEWTASWGSTSSRYTKYNHGIYFDAAGTSSGSDYIEINPTENKYIYDTTISVSTGNMFYIGFEKYDANKTSTSNNSCTYVVNVKPSSDIVKQRFTGVVNLSNSLSGPCKYIRLRILNGWSGSDSGSTNIATVHQLSLREVPTSTDSKTRLLKTGVFQTDLLREDDTTAKIEKNIDMSINEFIEI